MPVDDLWYFKKRGPDGKRLPSKRHGRGKRYRVRYDDANGQRRERLFARKRDAGDWDANVRSGVETAGKVDQAARRLALPEYGERWRLSREAGWAVETRERVESNLRTHIYPAFSGPVRSITLTRVLEWLSGQLDRGTPKSSIRLYFDLLKAVLNAAVTDKVIDENPCDGVKLTQILRGLSRAPKWVPTDDQVLALLAAAPERYHAALWLGAGQGLRLGEVLGMEKSTKCTDFLRRELHVVQQLRYAPREYGGFYLSGPKAGSAGTVELDPVVAEHLAEHIRQFPPVAVDLVDVTSGDPVRRTAELLFTTARQRNPFNDKTWSREWVGWRTAAGWPAEHGGFHALRHYFATKLITAGVEPQAVQHALRHKTLRITLETYVGWWPERERPRGVVGAALQAAASRPKSTVKGVQDQC